MNWRSMPADARSKADYHGLRPAFRGRTWAFV